MIDHKSITQLNTSETALLYWHAVIQQKEWQCCAAVRADAWEALCPAGKAVGCIVISWGGKITTLKPHNLLPHPERTPVLQKNPLTAKIDRRDISPARIIWMKHDLRFFPQTTAEENQPVICFVTKDLLGNHFISRQNQEINSSFNPNVHIQF